MSKLCSSKCQTRPLEEKQHLNPQCAGQASPPSKDEMSDHMSIEASGSTITKNWFIERRTKWIDLEETYSFPRPLACPVCKACVYDYSGKSGFFSSNCLYAKPCQISFMGEVIWSHPYERMPIFIVSSLIHKHTQPLQSCGTWKEFIIEITIHIKKWLCKWGISQRKRELIHKNPWFRQNETSNVADQIKRNSPMLLW